MHSRHYFGDKIFWKRLSKVFKKYIMSCCGNYCEKQKQSRNSCQSLYWLPNIHILRSIFALVLLLLCFITWPFSMLIQRGFWVIPKITVGNLWNSFHNAIFFQFQTFSFQTSFLLKSPWRNKKILSAIPLPLRGNSPFMLFGKPSYQN